MSRRDRRRPEWRWRGLLLRCRNRPRRSGGGLIFLRASALEAEHPELVRPTIRALHRGILFDDVADAEVSQEREDRPAAKLALLVDRLDVALNLSLFELDFTATH